MIDFSDFTCSPKKKEKNFKGHDSEAGISVDNDVKFLGQKKSKRRFIEIDDESDSVNDVEFIGSKPGSNTNDNKVKLEEFESKMVSQYPAKDQGEINVQQKSKESSSICTNRIHKFRPVPQKRPRITLCPCSCDVCVPLSTWWNSRETELRLNQSSWRLRAHLMDTLDRSSWHISYRILVEFSIVTLVVSRHKISDERSTSSSEISKKKPSQQKTSIANIKKSSSSSSTVPSSRRSVNPPIRRQTPQTGGNVPIRRPRIRMNDNNKKPSSSSSSLLERLMK